MSKYIITKYSFEKAKTLNLIIKISKNPLKKLDVYNIEGKFIASIGSSAHMDYPSYCIAYNKEYADRRRELYHNRHKINATVMYSKQWLALQLLW